MSTSSPCTTAGSLVIFLSQIYYEAHNFISRHERHWRVATFFGAAALAGAFGGISSSYTVRKLSLEVGCPAFRYTRVCDRQDGWHRRKERLGVVSCVSQIFSLHPGDNRFDRQDIHPRRSSNYRRLPWRILRRTNLGLQSEIREDGPVTSSTISSIHD